MNRTRHAPPRGPEDRLTTLHQILDREGLTAPADRTFFEIVGEHWGLFWDPVPPSGTTGREIARQARGVAAGAEATPWVAALLRRSDPGAASWRRAWTESAACQVVRGRRILPTRPHRARRPEEEITRAIQMCDRYLHARRPSMSAKTRHHAIAGVMLAMAGVPVSQMDERDAQRGMSPREDMAHVVRMRLARAPNPLDEVGYRLLLWEAARQQDASAPFPFARRVPVWLYPTAEGRVGFEVIVEPPGGLGDTFGSRLDQAIQDRLQAGPLREPGEGVEVEVPAGTR